MDIDGRPSTPSAGQPITRQNTARCPLTAKRLLLCLFLLAVTAVTYFMTPQFWSDSDARGQNISPAEVSKLIKEWEEDHPLLKDTSNNNPLSNTYNENNILKSQNRIVSNRKRTRLQNLDKIKKRRQKNDEIADKMAAESKGQPHYVNYNLNGRDVQHNQFECVMLKTTPRVPICLYADEVDIFVSKQIRSTGLWEGHIVVRFQDFLSQDPSLGFIDVGANLGQYSLVAAAMGHQVLAVEPWEASLVRMRRAAQLGKLQGQIHVLQNVVSDSRTPRCLREGGDNQGDVRIIAQQTSELDTPKRANTCKHEAFSLHLNDLLANVTFKKALLKLDIQAQEHRALLHAEVLLDAIFVPHIFMEWVIMREFWVTSSHESLDKAIVRRLVALLTRRQYRVFSLVTGRELDIRYWYGWPEDVLWTHSSVLT